MPTDDHRYIWMIMLYLAGDNNLSDEMVWALKELNSITLPDGIAVTIQFDPSGKGSPTRFYQLKPWAIDGSLRVLKAVDVPEDNSANPTVLAKFIERSVNIAKAKYYALILSGHGSGILGDFLTDNTPTVTDSGTLHKGSLTIPELREAFKILKDAKSSIRHVQEFHQRPKLFDVLGMDSCLMSMAEVATEIKDYVQYLVGSEGFLPNAGWPYYRLIEKLKTMTYTEMDQHLDPRAFVTSLVHRCTNYYADYYNADISIDMSACDLDKVGPVEQADSEQPVAREVNKQPEESAALTTAIRRFALFATGPMEAQDKNITDLIILAHWRAQSYKWELYTDIWDFFNELDKACTVALPGAVPSDPEQRQKLLQLNDLQHACAEIMSAVEKSVVCSGFAGPEFQHSHGLSIYFPWSEYHYASEYQRTAFAIATKWHDFLHAYFKATRREVREQLPDTPRTWKRYLLPNSAKGGYIATGQPVATQPSLTTGRIAPPQTRIAPPQTRIAPPQTRILDLVNLIGESRSRMKNPATDSKDYLIFPPAEAEEFEKKARDNGGGLGFM